MRLITWNCRVGGFRNKATHIVPLRPDILTVQEVSAADGNARTFAGDAQPTFRDQPSGPGRHIGVYSYTGVELRAVGDHALFRRYEASHNAKRFQVVAVWTAPTSQSRKTWYMQAIEGVQEHAGWMGQAPTVIMGDFNDNASYRLGHWRQLLDLLEPLGLVSAYHEYFREPFGSETRPTHFFTGRETAPFHLDYCFVPRDWAPRTTNVEVGTYSSWCGVSDHAPLIVDLDL